jgi:2'-5' RNA ligase
MGDPAFLSDRINSFSLVSYIPGPLGEFITDLRQELVSGCVARSHVTVLPPRPIEVPIEEAEDALRRRVELYPAFEVEILDIGLFTATNVVIAEIGVGRNELIEMHAALNSGPLAFDEPYDYHPHITLAQNFPPELLAAVYATAKERWDSFPLRRSFLVDSLIFVQNTVGNRWLDLAECDLRGAVAIQSR